MAEELGLSGLLGLSSPDGKSPSKGDKGSRSPKKVTKEVIYKKFDKAWERSSHGVLKDRYDSKPHKPPVLDKRDLARLADPIKGRYKSLAEYEDRVGAGLDDSTDEYAGGGGAFLTDIGIENRSNMSMEMDPRTSVPAIVEPSDTGGIFLTENMDGSVSPVKQSSKKVTGGPEQGRNVQYNRSGQPGGTGFQRGRQGSGVSSRNGAVSRLKGKLEEASRLDYKRGRGGLQSSVLNASSDRLSAGIANRRGVVPGASAQRNSNRFGASTGNLRSVRSSGYGTQQNTNTGGIAGRGRGATRNSQNANNTSMRGGRGVSSTRRGSINRKEDLNKSTSNENNNPNEKRGRVYSRPGVPRLSRQPVGSMQQRSKSRGRSGRAGTAEDKEKEREKEGGAGVPRSTGASRGRMSRENSANGGSNSTSRLSRSSSRTRGVSRDADSREGRTGAGGAVAGGRASASSSRRGGGPMARTGSAGGGLAAVRERRAGTGTGAQATGEDKKDISFRRLGNRETAASRKRKEDALKRSQKGAGNNNNAASEERLNRARISESAPTSRRPGAQLDESRKKSAPTSMAAQSTRSRTAGGVSKKGASAANPLAASASAPSMQPPKDTTEVLKALAGVQESEQKRQERAGTAEDSASSSSAAAAAAAASGKASHPTQALSKGPGGRGAARSVGSGKDAKADSAREAATGSDTSMAAVLAAKASKLQAQFQKADSLRSSFQAVDEAEAMAMNLETRGLGDASFMPDKASISATMDTDSGTPEKKASPSKQAKPSRERELQELQKSMDEGKLRSMIESDKGFDDLR